jgi:hypothetical protein
MKTDQEIILMALQRERDELHERIMQIDRIIKRVVKASDIETADYRPITNTQLTQLPASQGSKPIEATDLNNIYDLKVLVINIFNSLGKATKLKEIQAEYFRITGQVYNIREIVRSLHRSKIVCMIRLKHSSRGVYWVKAEWVNHGTLLDEYKPIGFDNFYKAEDFIFE